jgi:L-cysteine S-thiosulfotransferase
MSYRLILSAIVCVVVFSSLLTSSNAHDYTIVDDAIPVSLTGVPGDPVKGKKLAVNRKKGNCLACHAMPIPEQQFHGEVGPDLSGVGSRMTEPELRLRLVNSKALNPDTIMPAFHKVALNRVLKKFKGKTILGAQEIEDIIAYISTLKS